MKRCIKAKKTSYPTRRVAGQVLMKIWARDPSGDFRDLHVYKCPWADHWHVGHWSYYQKTQAYTENDLSQWNQKILQNHMNKINVSSLRIVRGLPPIAKKGDKVAIDSEFFGQDKKRLHRPHGTFAWLGCSFDGKTVYYITNPTQIQEFFDRLEMGVWIFVNAKYDFTQLRRFAHLPQRKNLWDCFLIEQIMYSGFYNDFSLADMARRRLDLYLPKDTRESFSETQPKPSGGQINLSQEQIEYAASDVVATWLVYQDQRAEIDENDLNIWRDIELPFLWTLMAMDGIKLDTGSWTALAQKNERIAKEIQDKYGHWETVQGKKSKKQVFEGLNLNSPAQVKAHLHKLGHKVSSTGVEELEKLADECEFVKELMTYRTYSKRSSTYGEKFIAEHVESDGKIYGDIYQMGAETGRTSSRHPNLQNQPNETEYRSCFVADDGNCLVVADYGSQEPRIAAYFSKDERLIEILNSGKKLYIEIARDVFGMKITKQDEMYGYIKSTILGIFYGMSAFGLSGRLGVSEEEAQEMINKILKTYPGIQDYIDLQKKAGDYVQSIYGRKIWLNKYDKGWLRGALNYPIQSSAADATKLAASRFLEKWGYNSDGTNFPDRSPLRLLIHDEIVVEVPETLEGAAKNILEESMVEVAEEMHEGLKGVAEVFVGKNWGCKH